MVEEYRYHSPVFKYEWEFKPNKLEKKKEILEKCNAIQEKVKMYLCRSSERASVEQLLYYMKEAIEGIENDRIPSSSLAGGV